MGANMYMLHVHGLVEKDHLHERALEVCERLCNRPTKVRVLPAFSDATDSGRTAKAG